MELFAPIDLLIAKRDFMQAQKQLLDLFWAHPEDPTLRYTAMEKIVLISDKSVESLEWLVPQLFSITELPDEFIQFHALKSLEIISDFRPNFFLAFNEACVHFTFAEDPQVREIAINIIGNILKSSLAPQEELFSIFILGLTDESWQVRLRVLDKAREIFGGGTLAEDQILEILPQVVKLLGTQEELRDPAIDFLILMGGRLSNEIFLPALMQEPLAEDPDVQNSILFIIGEIARENPTRFNLVIPHIMKFFVAEDELVQTQASQAVVKIALGDLKHTIPILIQNLAEVSDAEMRGLEEVLTGIGEENPDTLLPYMLDAIEDPNPDVRASISKVLKDLYHEVPQKIEARLYGLIGDFEHDSWRKRLQAVKMVSFIASLISSTDYLSFIAFKLQDLFSDDDIDVSEEAQRAFRHLQKINPNLADLIVNFQKKKQDLEIELQELRTLPKILRLENEKLIDAGALDQAKIELEQDFKRFNDRIQHFDLLFQQSHQKSLVVGLFEDWLDIKEEVLNELGDVKTFLSDKIMTKRDQRQEELGTILRHLFKRKIIIESQFEVLKLQLAQFTKTPEHSVQDGLNIDPFITLRTKLFEFETDLNKVYVNYMDFKPLFNSLARSWQELKTKILKMLERQNQAVKEYYRKVKESPESQDTFRDDYTFEVIVQELLELVSESIRVYLDSVENLEETLKPVYNFVEFGDFARAREALNFRISDRFRDIDQRNNQIEKLTEDFDLLFADYDRAKNIRTYVENWQYIRDEVVHRIKRYQQDTIDLILAKEVSGLLQMANPLKLSKIASYVQMPETELREIVMRILDKKLIFAHIQGGSLKAHSYLTRPERIFSIRKNYEVAGNRLKFTVRILNTSSFLIRDVSVILKLPCLLELADARASQDYCTLGDFEPNATKKVEWALHVSTDPNKRRMKLGSVKLMINFTDFENQPKSKVKVFDFFVY